MSAVWFSGHAFCFPAFLSAPISDITRVFLSSLTHSLSHSLSLTLSLSHSLSLSLTLTLSVSLSLSLSLSLSHTHTHTLTLSLPPPSRCIHRAKLRLLRVEMARTEQKPCQERAVSADLDRGVGHQSHRQEASRWASYHTDPAGHFAENASQRQSWY